MRGIIGAEVLVPRQQHAPHVPRETFIALRARRAAYRIATDILYGRAVDVRVIECPACHSQIEPHQYAYDVAVCHACGQRVVLPSHLRLKPRRELSSIEIEAAAEDERLTARAQAKAAREERRLLWACIIIGAALLIVLFYALYVLNPRVRFPGAF
jgi:hypothetical protein